MLLLWLLIIDHNTSNNNLIISVNPSVSEDKKIVLIWLNDRSSGILVKKKWCFLKLLKLTFDCLTQVFFQLIIRRNKITSIVECEYFLALEENYCSNFELWNGRVFGGLEGFCIFVCYLTKPGNLFLLQTIVLFVSGMFPLEYLWVWYSRMQGFFGY